MVQACCSVLEENGIEINIDTYIEKAIKKSERNKKKINKNLGERKAILNQQLKDSTNNVTESKQNLRTLDGVQCQLQKYANKKSK